MLDPNALAGLSTINDLLGYLHVPDPVWNSFISIVGDPVNDVRLLAALPRFVLVQALGQAVLPDGTSISPIQAAQVGLVWRSAKMMSHLRAGGVPEEFIDIDPWEPDKTRSREEASASTVAPKTTASLKEKVLKMASVIDQTDESEFAPAEALLVQGWNQHYVNVMGAHPEEDEDATDEQLAGLFKRVREQDKSPYVDFGVWGPYGRKALKTQKHRTFVPLGDGSFLQKEMPGPVNLQQWMASWRVFKVAAISLNIVSLAALQLYEKNIEKLVITWPKCWGLIASADDKGRAEKLEKLRRRFLADESMGKNVPDDWDRSAPWTCCFRILALDEKFWSEEVRHPAAAWTASGEFSAPLAPADAIAQAHLPGGLSTIHAPREDRDERRRQANKDRRMSRKKRQQADREELQRLKSTRSNPPSFETKGKGKGKAKDNGGAEICFSWAKGIGGCADLPPGSECRGKVKRAHKCQHCLSPGHQNKDCTSK